MGLVAKVSVEAAYFAQHPTTYDDDPQDKETGRKASQSREAGWMLINYTGVIITIKGSSPTETNAGILIVAQLFLHDFTCILCFVVEFFAVRAFLTLACQKYVQTFVLSSSCPHARGQLARAAGPGA